MPFIIARVNVSVMHEQEEIIKSRLGRAIELVPGKSEQYLMICFQDNCRFWLRGDNSLLAAYIEVSIFGNERHYGYESLTQEITRAFHDVLGIPSENIYLKYDDIHVWGVASLYLSEKLIMKACFLPQKRPPKHSGRLNIC